MHRQACSKLHAEEPVIVDARDTIQTAQGCPAIHRPFNRQLFVESIWNMPCQSQQAFAEEIDGGNGSVRNYCANEALVCSCAHFVFASYNCWSALQGIRNLSGSLAGNRRLEHYSPLLVRSFPSMKLPPQLAFTGHIGWVPGFLLHPVACSRPS